MGFTLAVIYVFLFLSNGIQFAVSPLSFLIQNLYFIVFSLKLRPIRVNSFFL